MTRAMRFAVRLYPRAWRERYADEFAALLDQTGPSHRDFVNVCKGAFDMQLRALTFWKLAATGAILGAIVLGAWAFRQPVRYVSRAMAAVNISRPEDLVRVLNTSENQVFDRAQIAEIIGQHGLYQGRKVTAEMIDEMRRSIDLRVIGRTAEVPELHGQSSFFQLSYRGPKAEAAEAVNSELLSRLSRSLSAQSGPDGRPLTTAIIDPPTPARSINKAVSAMLAIGSVLGAVLFGIAYAIFRLVSRLFRPAAQPRS